MEDPENENCCSHLRNCHRDIETGERIIGPRRDSETGEEEYNYNTCPRKIFKIPPSYYTKKPKEKVPKIETDKEQAVKTEICPSRGVAALLFLLPTTLFFTPAFSVIVVVAEIILHVWAHRKNRKLRNENVFYQSPLHIIIQEFCGACKDRNAKMKISKFQEARADKFRKYSIEYVRRIVNKKLLIS